MVRDGARLPEASTTSVSKRPRLLTMRADQDQTRPWRWRAAPLPLAVEARRNRNRANRFIVAIDSMGYLAMRFRWIQRLIQRRRRKSSPGLWQFGLDVREVMLARTSRAMTGNLSETEARRMVLEKQSAAIRAQLAYTRALLRGDPASASREVFDICRSAVQSNRKRLRKLRP